MNNIENPPTALELVYRLSLDTKSLPNSRIKCMKCSRTCNWYCPTCLVSVLPSTPRVRLPIRLDILRGRDEIDSKSTSAHALALAPDDSRIFFLPSFPVYTDPRRVLVLYPCPSSVPISKLADVALENVKDKCIRESTLFDEAVERTELEKDLASRFDAVLVVDSTWNKVGGVMQMPQMRSLLASGAATSVHIAKYHTLFWRYQPLGPQCVSTIEAIYYFYRELFIETSRLQLSSSSALSSSSMSLSSSSMSSSSSSSMLLSSSSTAITDTTIPLIESDLDNNYDDDVYDGRFDDLLLFFLGQYHRVQAEYTEGDKANKNFTAKMRQGYIRGRPSIPEDVPPAAGEEGKKGEKMEDEEKEDESTIDKSESAQIPPKRVRIKSGWTVSTGLLSETSKEMTQMRNKRFVEHCAPPSVRDSTEATVGVEAAAFSFAQATMEREYSVKQKSWRGKANNQNSEKSVASEPVPQ